ncbi:MAG TPA: hypothetical protein VGM50_14150 [Gemmatimonadaceae bacterium]|jgi:hypothetical protein
MSPLFGHRLRVLAALSLLGVGAASCTRAHGRNTGSMPTAEFLLSSVDSTFWVTTKNGVSHVRGVPLVLARYGGKFYELFVSDDDFSYDDAQLLGERLYRRDLVSGDSLAIFADTIVPRIAVAYARSHPDERPLEPNEEGEANPSTNATAQVNILDVFGPYLSYEYQVDVDTPRGDPWRSTRRGVIDLRSGKEARLADLFGDSTGHRLEEQGRRTYETTRDSIVHARAGMSDEDRAAADALLRLQFDSRSFSLSDLDGQPAVSFGVPGKGSGEAGHLLELDPLKVAPTPWWRDALPGLANDNDELSDVWNGPGYRVIAHYDTVGDGAHIALANAGRREWPLTSVLGPLRRVTWLDRPPVSEADRSALLRAFSAAASYDEASRVAAGPESRRLPFERVLASGHPLRNRVALTFPLHLVSHHARNQDRSRKSARNVRAHDARAREQHGPRVRRRHSIDDGQDGSYRRLPTQPRERRHRVDRSRRLSPADSSR